MDDRKQASRFSPDVTEKQRVVKVEVDNTQSYLGIRGQTASIWHVAPPLYDARFEHDACGIGFLADLSGRPTHRILDDGLRCLERLAHRGALDADGKSGDGAGILCSIPMTLINRELERIGQQAHHPGEVAVGMVFLPREPLANARAREIITAELERRGLPILAWRTVVHEPNVLGKRALEMLPDIQQVIVARPYSSVSYTHLTLPTIYSV